MTRSRAIINWISEAQGGRRRPPAGVGLPPYAPIVRFADEPWPPDVAWSLVVEKDEALSESSRWVADVRFLVDEAPHEAIRPERHFELYEGNRRVAWGWIVGDPSEDETAASGQHELTGRSA